MDSRVDPLKIVKPYLESLTYLSLIDKDLGDIANDRYDDLYEPKQKVVEYRTETAAQTVFNSSIPSYNIYKEKLNSKMSFHRLLIDVKKSKLAYKEGLPTTTLKVAEAMNKMVEVEEKKERDSFMPRFFQRLGNVFTFGFKTDIEYAEQLIREMKGLPSEKLRSELKDAIYLKGDGPQSIQDIDFAKYDELDDEQFKILLEDVIFSQKENIDQFESPKYIFFSNLSPTKKEQFMKILVSREDWFSQLYELSRSTDTNPTKIVDNLFTKVVKEKIKSLKPEEHSKNCGIYHKNKSRSAAHTLFFSIYSRKRIDSLPSEENETKKYEI